ncbi:hypothetical protein LTR91_016543 [Friedmanniomyces endolithicus]|uniref:MoaB/Mog domain-containing protein n=1 Tax=Friedmanniomyces endolithicus TaxID=329885 RepID=A0AAN6K7S6_9PEZI|nr:hypothetical protein LTR91_016543 [Friedmanniomyces endolithicus]
MFAIAVWSCTLDAIASALATRDLRAYPHGVVAKAQGMQCVSTMSAPSKLRAAILIISETASKDPTTDKGIAALQEVFTRIAGDRWDANETRIVPDNVHDIQRSIKGWCDGTDPINLIATSGGTGFAQKDVTPEVSNPLALLFEDDPSLLHVAQATLAYR